MYFPLFVGVPCLYLSLFCFALFCGHFSFAIILKRKRKLVPLQMSCYSKCCIMALPHGAMGWSAVCGCGIS